MVSRRLLGNIAPGATPQKRTAPDGVIDGQIQRPGAAAAPAVDALLLIQVADTPSKKKKKAAEAPQATAPVASSSSDDFDASSLESGAGADILVIDAPTRLARTDDARRGGLQP
jgi:hypothetical protein